MAHEIQIRFFFSCIFFKVTSEKEDGGSIVVNPFQKSTRAVANSGESLCVQKQVNYLAKSSLF